MVFLLVFCSLFRTSEMSLEGSQRVWLRILTFEKTKKMVFLLVFCSLFRTFAADLVCFGSKKLSHDVTRQAEKPVKQLITQCTQL